MLSHRAARDQNGDAVKTTLLEQGVTLMLVGMGTVFVFLSVLVAAMVALSALSAKFVTSAIDTAASDEEVAAITAAIAQHRHSNKI